MKYFAFVILALLALVSCINATKPERCLNPAPEGDDKCKKLSVGFYYNQEKGKCDRWVASGCIAEGAAKTYRDYEECQKECE